MNIGIIVYSLSGHTLSVAEKVKTNLSAAGHAVTLKHIEIEGPVKPANETAPLKSIPAVEPYDALIFATPVRGGVLPPPVQRYFEQIGTLSGKQVAILVTGFFPYKWGRMQVIAQMGETLAGKGVQVCAIGHVGWFSLKRGAQIKAAVEHLNSCFE